MLLLSPFPNVATSQRLYDCQPSLKLWLPKQDLRLQDNIIKLGINRYDDLVHYN
jgi:hypothetical protein